MSATTLRFATASEIEQWDALIATNPDGAHFVQTSEFARIKAFDGLTARFLVFERGGEAIYQLALEGAVSLGRYWYLPMGPTSDDMAGVVRALRAFARDQRGILAVKIEPHLPRTQAAMDRLTALGLRRSRDMQVMTHTVVVDLTVPDLEMSFQKKLRSSIRGARNKGYRVERVEPSSEVFDTLYGLMLTVQGGRGMRGMREREYYDVFWGEFSRTGNGRFYFGYDDDSGEVKAAIFVVTVGTAATYKDAGSRPDRAIPGGAALLLATAMEELKSEGYTSMDLGGTPPLDRFDDSEHPFYNLGQFKKRFGEAQSFLPSFDLVLSPVKHAVWEHVVRRIEWRIKRGPDTLR